MPPLKPAVGPKSLTPIKILEDIEQAEGITTGHHGEIVVTSFEEHKVLIYSEDFELITEFSGMSLPQEDRFLCPRSVAVFDNNSLLLLGVDTLQKLTLEGELLASMGKLKKGKGPLEFGQPSGIAIGKDGRVYISEVDNQRIQILNSDFTHCGFAVNPELTKKAKDSPQALAINSEGNVYMVDQGNSNVQVFSPEGKFLFKFGKHGSPIVWGALTSPMALAIDCRDNVYVGNATGIISIFNKEGKFVRSFGAHGEEPGEFYLIRGMHVDKKDRLYVCEWTTNRVQVFQL